MDIIEKYEIRTDVLCAYDAHHHVSIGRSIYDQFQLGSKQPPNGKQWAEIQDDIKILLAREESSPRMQLFNFLSQLGLLRPTEELYNEYIQRHPSSKSDEINAIDLKAMKNQILAGMDIVDDGHKINEYYFVDEHSIQTPSYGVILNQPISIDPARHYEYFRFFFAFMLKKATPTADFLSYHLNRSFNGDFNKYESFLRECIAKEDISDREEKSIEAWLSQNQPSVNRTTVENELLNAPELIRISPIVEKRAELIRVSKIYIKEKSSKPEIYGLLDAAYDFDLVEGGFEECEYDAAFSAIAGYKIKRLKKEPRNNFMYEQVTKYLKHHDIGHEPDTDRTKLTRFNPY